MRFAWGFLLLAGAIVALMLLLPDDAEHALPSDGHGATTVTDEIAAPTPAELSPDAGSRSSDLAAGVERNTAPDTTDSEKHLSPVLRGRIICTGPRFDWPPLLRWTAVYGMRASTTADEDGSFELDGDPRRGGVLFLPGAYRVLRASGAKEIEVDGRRVRFLGPVSELEVEVFLPPALTGVVQADGSPIETGYALAAFMVGSATSQSTHMVSCDCDAAGQFRLPLPARDDILEVRLEFKDLQTGRLLKQVLASADLPADLNLGVIELPPARHIDVLVSAANGQPVQGADLTVRPSMGRFLTDVTGRARLEKVATTESSLHVACAGYVPLSVEIPDGHEGTLEVTLQTSPTLTIQLALPDDSRREDFIVMFSSDSPAFQLEDGAVPSDSGFIHPRTSTTRLHFGKTGGSRFTWAPRQDGLPVTLTGLRTGIVLGLKVFWRGALLEDRIIDPLHDGENRVIDIAPKLLKNMLRVVVKDTAGNKLRGVQVMQSIVFGRSSTGRGIASETDDSWIFPDIDTEGIRYEFEKKGFMPRYFGSIPPAVVILHRASPLLVTVLDADGNPLTEGVSIKATWQPEYGGREPESTDRTPTPEGQFELDPVPVASLEVTASTSDGRSTTVSHDPQSGDLVIHMQAQQ